MFPQLKACKGVEFLPGLCELARVAAGKIEGLGALIEIIEDDMFSQPWWADADIIYTSNICFPKEMNQRIARECEKARSGTVIMTLG